jgi:hypothetical protein
MITVTGNEAKFAGDNFVNLKAKNYLKINH